MATAQETFGELETHIRRNGWPMTRTDFLGTISGSGVGRGVSRASDEIDTKHGDDWQTGKLVVRACQLAHPQALGRIEVVADARWGIVSILTFGVKGRRIEDLPQGTYKLRTLYTFTRNAPVVLDEQRNDDGVLARDMQWTIPYVRPAREPQVAEDEEGRADQPSKDSQIKAAAMTVAAAFGDYYAEAGLLSTVPSDQMVERLPAVVEWVLQAPKPPQSAVAPVQSTWPSSRVGSNTTFVYNGWWQ